VIRVIGPWFDSGKA